VFIQIGEQTSGSAAPDILGGLTEVATLTVDGLWRLVEDSRVFGVAIILFTVAGLGLLATLVELRYRRLQFQGGWWLLAPAVCLSTGLLGALFRLQEIVRYIENHTLRPGTVHACLASALDPVKLGLLAAAFLAMIQALVLVGTLLARGKQRGRTIELNRLATTGFMFMTIVGGLVAYELSTGGRWTGYRVSMAGWFEFIAVTTAVGTLCLLGGAIRRTSIRERCTVYGLVLLAVALVVVTMVIHTDWIGFRTIGYASAEQKLAILAALHVRNILLRYGIYIGLTAIAIVFLVGIPGLFSAAPEPVRTGAPRRGLLTALVLITLALSIGTHASFHRITRSLGTLEEARRLSNRDTQLAMPVGLDGQPVSAAWSHHFYPLPGNSCLVHKEDDRWSGQVVLPQYSGIPTYGPSPDPPPVCPEQSDELRIPLDHRTEVILSVPPGMAASEVCSAPWFESEYWADRGYLYVLLAQGLSPPDRVLHSLTTPAMEFRWQSDLWIDADANPVEWGISRPRVWLIDTHEGVLVVDPASSHQWLFRDAHNPMVRLSRQLTWSTEVYLVAGDYWTVQDLVSLCGSARETSEEPCVLTDIEPESFFAYRRAMELRASA